MHSSRVALIALALSTAAPSAIAITLGQVDDFQDESVMNWKHGPQSPAPPSVRTGGPEGAADVYLANVSTGEGREGSRMVLFNESQWTGDYVTAGVDVIRTHMLNLGAGPLLMRVAMQDTNQVGTPRRIVSLSPIEIPADGQWHQVEFRLNAIDMTVLSGESSVEQVLGSVATLRILSSAEPNWIGDRVAGDLGMDNIEAGIVTSVEATTWTTVKALYGRR